MTVRLILLDLFIVLMLVPTNNHKNLDVEHFNDFCLLSEGDVWKLQLSGCVVILNYFTFLDSTLCVDVG